MYIVIIGCGKTGSKLARKLSSQNNDVVVIDNDKERLSNLNDSFDGKILQGIEFDKTILEKANIKDADCVIVTDDNDNTNIMVAQVVYNIYNVKNIVLKLQNSSMAKLYKDGPFKVICPTNIICDEILKMI